MSSLQTNRLGRWRLIHVFFSFACLAAGCMFVYKLFAFLTTIKRDELAGFAFDPLIVYGLVAAGFLFLLGWAAMTGQFRDIEKRGLVVKDINATRNRRS